MIRALVLVAGLSGPVAAQEGAQIVILGEVHDNPAHHLRQAEIMADVAPAAVVFEMLSPAQVAAAEGIDRADSAALEAAFAWEAAGWPAFAMYHPVFLAAADAPILGAALPREEVRRAFAEGAAAVFGAEADAFGLGPLDPSDQATREAEQMEAHCNALPEEMLPGMVEAQRLRDAHFARVTLAALAQTGGPVVVITGNGHARRDQGIPAALAAAAPEITVWTLGQFEEVAPDAAAFDAVEVTAATERPDPCAAFR